MTGKNKMLKINVSISFILLMTIMPITTALCNHLNNSPILIPIIDYLLSSENNTHSDFPIPNISESQKQDFLTAINNTRSQIQNCGIYGTKPPVAPLVWSDKLYNAAYTYDYDMVYGSAWSHTGSGTEFDIVAMNVEGVIASQMEDRIKYYDYTYYSIAENIAMGYSSIEQVMANWLSSDGHCNNLMNADFTEMGMAVLYNKSRKYQYYWTQNFGRPY